MIQNELATASVLVRNGRVPPKITTTVNLDTGTVCTTYHYVNFVQF